MSYVPVGRVNLGKHVSHGLVYTVLIIELLIFLSIACKIPSDPSLTLEFACFRELEWRIVFFGLFRSNATLESTVLQARVWTRVNLVSSRRFLVFL